MTEDRLFKLVNSDGEHIGDFNPDEQIIRTKKQVAAYQAKHAASAEWEKYKDENGNFIWAYPEKIKFLTQYKEFTKSDMTLIFYLSTYVNGSGYLAYGNTVRMDKKGIHDALGLSKNAWGTFFNKLVKHEILIASGNNFKWSTDYNFYGSTTGKANPKMLVRTFVNQIRELYEAKNAAGKGKYSPSKLYPVFALVPYLHHSSNVVCKNPDVKDTQDIEYFSLTEVADLLDLTDSKKMTSSLSSLLLDGQTTFVKVESKNEKFLKLNPRIFWRGTVAPAANIVGEFDMIDNNRSKRKKS